jgi:hypothetical protein
MVISANGGGNWIRLPQGDNNARINIQTGQGLYLLQGSDLGREIPISLQPFNTSRAPFQHRLQGYSFNGQTDPAYFVGYNTDHAAETEPTAYMVIEANYYPSTGVRTVEHYFQCAPVASSSTNIYRPFAHVMNVNTGTVTSFVQYAGAQFALIGGPVGGPATQQIAWSDGSMLISPANYSISATNGLYISTGEGQFVIASQSYLELLGTALYLQSTSGATNVTSADYVALVAGGGQPIYQDTNVLSWRTQAQSEVAHGDTTVSGFRMYPTTDGTGSVGIAGNRWGNVSTCSVSVAQVTTTATYTIDSRSTPDGEVWVDSSASVFTVTLPAPTPGRRLWIVDCGNSLATNPVILARHGSETINGSSASLLLVTSGARYEISSDGTNWWVNKMLMGG